VRLSFLGGGIGSGEESSMTEYTMIVTENLLIKQRMGGVAVRGKAEVNLGSGTLPKVSKPDNGPPTSTYDASDGDKN